MPKTKVKRWLDTLLDILFGAIALIISIALLAITAPLWANILAIIGIILSICMFLKGLSAFWTEDGLGYWPWDREFWGLPSRGKVGYPIPLAPRTKTAARLEDPQPETAEELTVTAETEATERTAEATAAETAAENAEVSAETKSEQAEVAAENDATKEAAAEQAERTAEHTPSEAKSELAEANSEVAECNSEASESWSEAAEDPAEYGEASSEVAECESEASESYSEHGIPADQRPPFTTGA